MSRGLIVLGILAAVIVASIVFRPELLLVDRAVDDGPAARRSRVSSDAIAGGVFRSVAHQTTGLATIRQGPDGDRVLWLDAFETSNGPDLRVLLIAAGDAADAQTVEEANPVELAPLQGNAGTQSYPVPGDLDLEKYRAVVIWCERFGVNFGTAPLALNRREPG